MITTYNRGILPVIDAGKKKKKKTRTEWAEKVGTQEGLGHPSESSHGRGKGIF